MEINKTQKKSIMSRYKYAIGILFLGAFLSAMLIIKDAKANAEQKSLIVQGANTQFMINSIESVGGEVLYTFKVINAVSAVLTDEQQAQLAEQVPLLTFFEDATVELEGVPAKQRALQYKVKKSEIIWSVKLDKNAQVDSLEAHWPEANGELNSVAINGSNVDVTKSGNSFYVQLDQKIKNGKLRLSMSFDTLSSVKDNDYDISLNLASGQTVSLEKVLEKALGKHRDTHVASHVRADVAHRLGITGKGVTVAIIDSGLASFKAIEKNTNSKARNIHTYNVLDASTNVADEYGHGTHLSSIITNSSIAAFDSNSPIQGFNGIAPDVDLLAVKAFDQHGLASYTDVLKAIDYVVSNKDELNVKVLNLSFSAQPSSFYWQDPINQALMVAWQQGITVIASAGNRGPEAQTIGVPGNNPYVLTVGAVSDNYTPNDYSDDFITSFSSAGPTIEGFIKPEIVAPGGHVQGLLNSDSYIAENFSMFDTGHDYYEISGTSQSTAITTGIAALLLSQFPDLTPDQVKCQLMQSAKLMVTEDLELTYSLYQQGKGVVDTVMAFGADNTQCNDNSEALALEIADEEHYLGPVEYDEATDTYFIEGHDALSWDGVYNDGSLWGRIRYLTNDGSLWGRIRHVEADGSLWGRIGKVNVNGSLWGRIRHVEANGSLWGRIRHVGNDSTLWDDVKASDPGSTNWQDIGFLESDGSLWGRIRDLETDGSLWGRIRDLETDGSLWGRIKDVEANGSLWGRIRDIETDGSLWGRIRDVEANGSLWGRIRDVETDGSLWGRIGNLESDGSLWGRIGDVEVDGSLWGRIRTVEVDGSLWGRIRTVTNDGSLWGRIKNLETNGSLWGRIRDLENDGSLWGRIRDLESNGSLWGRIRTLSNEDMNPDVLTISSNWVEQE